MPIATSDAENSSETAQPEYLQLLLGCSILALLLCIPIIAYTNQLKQAAAMLIPDRSTEVSAVETIPPSLNIGPAALVGAAPTAQLQTPRVFFSARQNQSVKVAPIRKSFRNHQGGEVLASPKAGFSKQIFWQQILTRPTSSRSWSRNDFPRHAKAALIAIWRHTLKRRQKQQDRSGSLLTHPD
jgi:hypothetical protein